MTVVEFLKQNLPSLFLEDSGHYAELFEQANELFEQQIKDAYKKGYIFGMQNRNSKPEEYYNETYKSKK
jgi:hypothetical protein